MTILSIIVPVYQVEQYIHPCLESLFKQGLNDDQFEVILVNDGTRDGSFDAVADIMVLHRNIKRVDQDNQGLSAARNTGMQYATGTYVLFVDSDDLLVEGSVAQLLKVAEDNSADLVVADFMKLSDEEISNYRPHYQEPMTFVCKTGSRLFLEDFNPSENYVWRTLYRREFLEDYHLRFIPGICYEDMPFTPECYLKAKIVVRAACPLYIYRMGHSSITSTMTPKKAMDLNKGIEHVWHLRGMDGISEEERQRLTDNLFVTFSFLLWCVSHNRNVLNERKTIVSDLRRRVPDLWFSNGIKQRLVSLLFRLMPNTYLKLRSL
jgi:glycosyltransferase involved in cell wall biosynthesis